MVLVPARFLTQTPLIVVRELKRQTAVASSAIARWVVSPALAHGHVASSSIRLDLPPRSMCRESGHGIPHMDASAAHPDAHRGCCVYHERAEGPPARGVFCRADLSADRETRETRRRRGALSDDTLRPSCEHGSLTGSPANRLLSNYSPNGASSAPASSWRSRSRLRKAPPLLGNGMC